MRLHVAHYGLRHFKDHRNSVGGLLAMDRGDATMTQNFARRQLANCFVNSTLAFPCMTSLQLIGLHCVQLGAYLACVATALAKPDLIPRVASMLQYFLTMSDRQLPGKTRMLPCQRSQEKYSRCFCFVGMADLSCLHCLGAPFPFVALLRDRRADSQVATNMSAQHRAKCKHALAPRL